MTLRHTVLIRFPDGADPAFIARLDVAMAEMTSAIPDVLEASWGADSTGDADHADYAMMFDFADRDGYEAYRVHPAHQAFIRDHMRAVAMTKTRIQFIVKTGASK